MPQGNAGAERAAAASSPIKVNKLGGWLLVAGRWLRVPEQAPTGGQSRCNECTDEAPVFIAGPP